jgi:hypothetical protein
MSSVPPGPPQGPPQGPPYTPPQGGQQPYPQQGGQQQYPPQGQQQYPPQYQQPYPQQQYPPQQYPAQMQPPPAKSNALKVVLIVVAVVVVLGIAGAAVTAYMVYHTVSRVVKDSGFDPDLMQKNPGLALTKLVATLHPDTEVVSTDDANGTVTVRDKKTGETLTFKWDPDKKTLVVVGDNGKQVKFGISGDDKSGTLTVDGGDGVVKFGAGAGNSTPAWAPIYPGTSPQGTFSTQTPQGNQNTYAFKTRDSPSKVLDYFKQQLTASGFKVTSFVAGDQGGMLQAADDGEKRSVLITAGTSSEGTEGSITTIEKK